MPHERAAKTQTHTHRGLRLFFTRSILHYSLHRKPQEHPLEQRRGGYYPPQNVPLSPIGKIVEQGILQVSSHYEYVSIDKYCIMSDHIHMILRIESDIDGRMISAPTVSTVVGSMKRWVSKQLGRPIWQKSFYDHGIRNQRDYDEIWEYIENNPLKYALKKAP